MRLILNQASRSFARALALVIVVALAVPALSAGTVGAAAEGKAPKRVTVVAAFYPLAEAVRRVGGPVVRVVDLTPAGAEPHDLELTPDQVDALEDARLAVVMGQGFQPGVEKVADRRDGPTLDVLAALHRDALDPHVWLDPTLMSQIVDVVQAELTTVDPARAVDFQARADAFRAELARLDGDYRAGLATCARHEIVTAHEAFGYLARRYGLTQLGVAGLSPDAEPGANRLAELADLAREDGMTTVFTEELVSPKVARTLAREAGGL